MKIKLVKAKPENKIVIIKTDFIKLDSFLKFVGISETGAQAKLIILEKKVKVNNQICDKRGHKLRPGDKVQYRNIIYTILDEK